MEILTIFMRLLLHPDAHLRLGALIQDEHEPPGFTQHMELTDLMGSSWPEIGYGLQFSGLSEIL